MAYLVGIQPSALKGMARLPRHIQERLMEKLQALGANPRPPGCKALRGTYSGYRIRVGAYRALYTVDDDRGIVTVYEVVHRKDVCR